MSALPKINDSMTNFRFKNLPISVLDPVMSVSLFFDPILRKEPEAQLRVTVAEEQVNQSVRQWSNWPSRPSR